MNRRGQKKREWVLRVALGLTTCHDGGAVATRQVAMAGWHSLSPMDESKHLRMKEEGGSGAC